MRTDRLLTETDSPLAVRGLRTVATGTILGSLVIGFTMIGGYRVGQHFSPPATAAATSRIAPSATGVAPTQADSPSPEGQTSTTESGWVVSPLRGLTVSAARSKLPKDVGFLVRYVNTTAESDGTIASQSPSPGARNVKTVTVVVRVPLEAVPIRSVLNDLPVPKTVRIRSKIYSDGFTVLLPFRRPIPPGIAKLNASLWVPDGGSRQQVVVLDGTRVALRLTLTPGVERKVAVPILEGQRLTIESAAGSAALIYIADAEFVAVKQ